MTPRDDVRELLPLYVLGLLEPDEAAAVERAVAGDASLAEELASYDLAAAKLIDGLVPVSPPASVRARLMTSVGPGRFERFASRVAAMYDVAVERARELFAMIDDPSTHDRSLGGGVLIHFQGGPAFAGADCGFIILRPGEKFPWHRHDGEEVALILQGTMIDCDGTVIGPGQEDHKGPGSEHEFVAGEGDDLIFCARVWGVRFDVEKPGA
jgi:quercetin dioxygenase-like cupin family protein